MSPSIPLGCTSLRETKPRFVAGHKEINMEQILIILVAGALGGVGAGKSSPASDLGMIGNIISGLVGGGLLGGSSRYRCRRSWRQRSQAI